MARIGMFEGPDGPQMIQRQRTGQPLALDEIFGQIRLKAWKSTGQPIKMLAEDDGTVRSQVVLYDGTTQRRALSETSGTLKVMNIGWDGSSETRFATETGGALKVMNFGIDGDGAVTRQFIEDFVQLDPVLVPAVEGVLLDGSVSLASGSVYQVTFEVVNIDGTNAVAVDIGVDIGAVGSLSGAEYYMKNYNIPGSGSSGVRTITIAGDDDIRGVAAVANDAAIHFIEVRRVA